MTTQQETQKDLEQALLEQLDKSNRRIAALETTLFVLFLSMLSLVILAITVSE
jgi:hypothetical protein